MTEPIIELEPHLDPATGQQIWAMPKTGPALATASQDGRIKVNTDSVTLPTDRFAGTQPAASEPAWTAATSQQDQGRTVSLSPTGELVIADATGAPAASVELTRDRFAAPEPAEIGSWRDAAIPGTIALPGAAPAAPDTPSPVAVGSDGQLHVAAQGVPAGSVTLTNDRFASSIGPSTAEHLDTEDAVVSKLRDARVAWIRQLTHTSRVPGMPTQAPVGWLYRPRPNKYGDQLVCVISFHHTTRLYHAHYWRYEADIDGRGRKAIELPRFLGRAPHLTHHKAHLYSGADGSAVLCLSERASGGMTTFESTLVQTMKWADGTGEVVRGKPFPYL